MKLMKDLLDARSYRELSVHECGKEECVKDKAISLTKKTYYLFHYVVNGKGTLILNKKEYHISKNTIFYIPPETDAIYFPDKENPWTYIWVGFDGEKVLDWLKALQVDVNNPLIFDSQKTLKKYFDDLAYRYNNNGFLDISMIGSLYQLFGEMLTEKEGKSTGSSIKVTIQLAKDFIHNNYQFDIGVSDIARNAHVTPNYLSTIFHREENMSTKSYLTKVRMKNAIDMLLSGKYKIKEVALKVGYDNQLHFSNEFKKYYGESPLHYLKEGIK